MGGEFERKRPQEDGGPRVVGLPSSSVRPRARCSIPPGPAPLGTHACRAASDPGAPGRQVQMRALSLLLSGML